MQNVVHHCIEMRFSIGGNMATIFKKEDAETCCGCNSKGSFIPANFASISAEQCKKPGSGMYCYAALPGLPEARIGRFHKSLDQIKKPIEEWESSEERHLSREYGVVVVPLKLTYSESQLLIEELGTDGLERFSKLGICRKERR
jgi:hypothetical protein